MKTKATIYNILAGYSNIIYSIISGLVLVPFYLDDFGSEVYGVWLATGNLISWIGILGGALSIVFAQNLAVSYAKNHMTEFRQLVGSGIILFTSLALLIYVGVLLASDLFLGLFQFNPNEFDTIKKALTMSALASSVSVFHSLLFYILGSWFMNAPVLYATLIGGGIGILLNISMLYYGFGLLSIPLSMIGKSVIIFILLYRSVHLEWIKRKLQLPLVNWPQTKILVIKSGPILLSNIASLGLNHSQSTIIGLLFGPTSATIVSLTDKLYSLIKTFIYPIGNAILQPLSSIMHKKEEFDNVSKKFIHNIDLLALLGILVCLIVNKAFITLWVGPEYFGGPWLSAGLAFSAFLIIRVSLVVSVLNAKGSFKTTSLYTIPDLVTRIISLVLLFYVFNLKSFAILPMAECVGVLIGTHLILAKHLPRDIGSTRIVYFFFLIMIIINALRETFDLFQSALHVISILTTFAFFAYVVYEFYKNKTILQIISELSLKFKK